MKMEVKHERYRKRDMKHVSAAPLAAEGDYLLVWFQCQREVARGGGEKLVLERLLVPV